MNSPTDFFISPIIFAAILIITFFILRKFCSHIHANTPTVKNKEHTLSDQSVIDSPTIYTSKIVEKIENVWSLEVNGTAKFNIKVDWSDGSTTLYSGVAPQVYCSSKPIGIIPVNTSGIAPEWADDGISYQWSLNGYHWS